MSQTTPFEVFAIAPPGLETALLNELNLLGYRDAKMVSGGVSFDGNWPDVWRANLELRCAVRVLARISSFRVMHLAQLDKRARKVPWRDILDPSTAVRVDASCRKSRIYHAGAAKQRVETALREAAGIPVSADAAQVIKVRIEDDLCTISVDTSGPPLYKRGHKLVVGKAPLRESMAAAFLAGAGYQGTEPVVDPMCGSGTFVIEAAEIARRLQPGRSRSFAFEQFANFDAELFHSLKRTVDADEPPLFLGSDRDVGAVEAAKKNAKTAGVSDRTCFSHLAVSDLQRPAGPAGLVITNPPYGARIGNKKLLFAVYGALGKTLKDRFSGWRVAIVTSEPQLAHATGLKFCDTGAPVPHGGLKVRLYCTGKLP